MDAAVPAPAVVTAGQSQKETPSRREKDKRHPNRKKTPSQGSGKNVPTTATPSSRPNRARKNSPFNTKMDPPFEESWDKEAVQRGLKSKQLIQGVLRINQKSYEDAYVDDPEGGGDYYISGILRRNRALEGDVVVLEVLPPEKWLDEERLQLVPEAQKLSTLQEVAPSLDYLQASASKHDGASETVAATDGPSPTATLVDRLYTVPDSEKVGREKEGEEREAHQRYQRELMKYRRTAKVVYIVDKGHSRTFGGHLKAFDKEKSLALLSPKDSKIPRVVIPLENCPPDYPQNPNKYQNTLFIGRILVWEIDSPFARGELMRSVGEAGEIEPETESFLVENEVEFGEFPAEALACLPTQRPWTIPQEEVQQRRDFREECVFTIDPETARDLDDALHVKEVEKGVYEVGVHIADVSYFVKAGSALDEVASSRATSVYLVQRVIPMLPRLLCEQLCSLNPNEDRLTVSVVWRLTPEGKFIDEWMGRSIIRSCAKLSYSHAQGMIDDPSRKWQKDELPDITNGFTASQVSRAVVALNELANGLRKQRESMGTLRLNQPKLKFTINKDTGLPSGCDVYEQRESNRLIEEFMLMANMAVARKIWRAFPDRAMLRRHPSPKEKSAQFLAQKCESLDIPLDVSSAASIQSSLEHYQGTSNDEESNFMQKMVLVSNCSKIMELARYFCTGTVEKEAEFRHYALNVPRYTHFTSPIRRYADIIVHRQLASSLGEGPDFTLSTEKVESQAHHCNKKKKSAKTVEELSMQMFFAIFIKECGSIRARGIVVQVLDRAFDVLVQHYGVTKRVYCEHLQLEKFKAHQKKDKSIVYSLTLEWPGEGGSTIKQELNIMSMVDVVLTSGQKPLQFDAKILPPSHPELKSI